MGDKYAFAGGGAHLLHSGRSNEHAFAVAQTVGQFLQVVARKMAGFIAEISRGSDLACHRGQHLSVLVLDGPLQGPGGGHEQK